MEISEAHSQSGYSSTVSRTNWDLEMLVFVEGGKPEYPEKNPLGRDKDQRQTQPIYDAEFRNQTQATLVEGEHSHHSAISSPLNDSWINTDIKFVIPS